MYPKVEVIGITIGDNDFCYTLRGFLKLFRDEILLEFSWRDPKYCPEITKEYVAELWRKSCTGLYYMFQNHCTYGHEETHEQHIKEYLGSDCLQVFFDEEAIEQFYGDHNSSRVFLWINWRDIEKSVISGEGDYTLEESNRITLGKIPLTEADAR